MPTHSPCRVVVLISGSGSNLQALIDTAQQQPDLFSIVAVLSNRNDAYGLQRAQQAQIPTHTLNHTDFADRLSFDQVLIDTLDQYQPDLVVLAGFMRILTPEFTQHYAGRLLNIHPSLLPKYKGLHTHQRALDAQDREHGCSVHFVTAELDGGPTVIQGVLTVQAEDTAESLAQRVHQIEHQIYPLAVQWFAQQRLVLTAQGASLDGQLLPSCGQQLFY
mgnify:FL=1